MRPGKVSAKLRQIAATIEKSGSPRLSLVLEDLRLLLAAIKRPMRYFAFPTDSNIPGSWGDPQFLDGMKDKVKDDFTLARIYGDVVGTYQKEDFYWVIEVESYDDGLIEELAELGITIEIPESDIKFEDITDPISVWWEQYGKNRAG